ncbi:MAG: SMP-30/gluconolactonase/LRE family protein, partial [Pseudomonadota bacterium]
MTRFDTRVYDPRPCAHGEGPLWHPQRQDLFWFDIDDQKLMAKGQSWTFDDAVSAAGWVDHDTLLVASERALFAFDVTLGRSDPVAELESEKPHTRSNDGRADPVGGFWIG